MTKQAQVIHRVTKADNIAVKVCVVYVREVTVEV